MTNTSNKKKLNRSVKLSKLFFYLLLAIIFVMLFFVASKGFIADQTPAEKAVLEVNGEVVAEFIFSNYNENEIIDLDPYGLKGKVEIKNGGARFIEMNCPDKICVKTSWIEDKQSIAVCMPNKASLYLK